MNESFDYLDTFSAKLSQLYGKEFNAIYKNEKGVIGGSFVLSTVTRSNWLHQDVDIYVGEKCDELEAYIKDDLGGIPIFNDEYEGISGNVIKCSKYLTQTLPINIIKTGLKGRKEIREYIAKISDLTICTSCHDGFKTLIHPHVFTRIAQSINEKMQEDFIPKEVNDKRCADMMSFFRFQDYRKKRKVRVLKYTKRGFTIMNISLSETDNILLDDHISNCTQAEQAIQTKIFRLISMIEMNCEGENIIYNGNHKLLFENLRCLHPHCISIAQGVTSLEGEKVTYEMFPFLKFWKIRYDKWCETHSEILDSWKEIMFDNMVVGSYSITESQISALKF